MKGYLLILLALLTLTPNESLFAQIEPKIEYYFGQAVTDSVAKYFSKQEIDEGQHFILVQGSEGGISRIALLSSTANTCDSLLLKRTNRFASINSLSIKILFAEDYNFSVHEWTSNPLTDHPKQLPKRCSVIHEYPFIIKFDRNGVIWTGYEN
ncbi:MAG: hypothetical protein RLN90_14415 [Balneolaceae bacterium]